MYDPKIADYEDALVYESVEADKRINRFWSRLAKISWSSPTGEYSEDESRVGRVANNQELTSIEQDWGVYDGNQA